MKKHLLIILLAITSIVFISCSKNYCAHCTESHTGYTPDDYCGKENDVDTYIDELKTQGAEVGQNWSCQKIEE